MKKISAWAKSHPVSSWAIITLCHFCIFYAAMFTGAILDDLTFHLPVTLLLASLITLAAAILCYPLKRVRLSKYSLQKICDFSVGLSVFVIICFLYNDNDQVMFFNNYNSLNGSLSYSKGTLKKDSTLTASHSLTKKELRIQKRKFRKTINAYRQQSSDTNAGKIAGITLIVIGALAGLTLVSALSCSLSCSGAGTAGAIVGLTGTVGFIWLAVWGIKKVLRSKPATGEKNIPSTQQ